MLGSILAIPWSCKNNSNNGGADWTFKDFGYDGFFIGRIDYEDYKRRMNSAELEFDWDGLWTSVNYNVYRQPPNFCWDVSCDNYRESDVQNNGFMVDDPELEGYNIETRVNQFLEHVKARTGYTTNNFMVTMGNDFHYINANKYFVNMDKLIYWINELKGDEYNAFYSTPTCYMHAVKNSKASSEVKTWTEYEDDFFPYCDGYFIPYEETTNPSDFHGYWSGYYTSRVSLKKKTRVSSATSSACNQWAAAGFIHADNATYLRRTVSLLQHHDAVTGTEKKKVVDDYDRRLDESMSECDMAYSKKYDDANAPYMSVYNPLGWDFIGNVELPNGDYTFMKVPAAGEVVLNSNLLYQNSLDTSSSMTKKVGYLNNIKFEDNFVIPADGPAYSYDFLYYKSSHNQDGMVASGAYIFRPWENTTYSCQKDVTNNLFRQVDNGQKLEVVYETEQKSEKSEYEDYINYSWRNNELENEDTMVMDYAIGPLPLSERDGTRNVGKEVILKFTFPDESDSDDASILLTDANSYKFTPRDRTDVRPAEPIASRYFPITSQAIVDFTANNKCFEIITDRAVGVASLVGNEFEIMLHRRTTQDDWKGMGEAMDDTDVIKGQLRIRYGTCKSEEELKRAEKKLTYRPIVRMLENDNNRKNSFNGLVKTREIDSGYSLLKKELPKEIHLLSLSKDTHNEKILVIRLENISGSKMTLNLNDYFEFSKSPEWAEARFLSGIKISEDDDHNLDLSAVEIIARKIMTMHLMF